MTKTSILSAILIIILSSVSYAGLHTWKDENGVIHFSDDPPANKKLLNDKSGYREIIKSEICHVPIYTIANDVNSRSKINGTYYPEEPSSEGFPRYSKRKKKKSRYRRETLSVEIKKGQWRWVISGGSKTYYSNPVPEGTAPSRAVQWFDRKKNSVPINVVEKKLALRNRRFDYTYIYDTIDILPDMCPWMNKGYEIEGLPLQELNGKYFPVKWSSPVPRYTNGKDVYLTANIYGDQWKWKLTNRGKTQFASETEPKGTMADKVQKWYEIRGRLYVTLSVREFTVDK